MVEEAAFLQAEDPMDLDPHTRPSGAQAVRNGRNNPRQERLSFAQIDRAMDPSGAFESPVKTSVNEEDGVIDVDFPFPDYIASFESAISSPSSSGYLSTPGIPGVLDSFESLARPSVDGDLPLNAAGWLSRFHPDFALQAIPPQDDLLEQVKATLRAEPTPGPISRSTNADTPERWIDVGSAIIADTTSGTVRRILLRRLVKTKPCSDRVGGGNPNMVNSSVGTPHTPSILPYETPLDEQWIEESVLEPDQPLADAMEKVISFNFDLAQESSQGSNHAHADLQEAQNGKAIAPENLSEGTAPPSASLDMPRVQCKTVVLSALEDIIRDAIDRHEASKDKNKQGFSPRSESVLLGAVRDWISSIDATD
jgi:hypothetical protein